MLSIYILCTVKPSFHAMFHPPHTYHSRIMEMDIMLNTRLAQLLLLCCFIMVTFFTRQPYTYKNRFRSVNMYIHTSSVVLLA